MYKIISIVLFIVICKPLNAQNIQINRIEGTKVAANSYIIENKNEVLVIDALGSSNDAKILATKIKESNKKLSMIFITHGHPDHFQGIVELRKHFPNTPIYVANESIKNDIIIYVNYAHKNGFFKNQSELVPKNENNLNGFDYNNIEIYNDSIIKFNKVNSLSIKVIREPMEAKHTTILASKPLNILFTSDLIYNKTFMWLGSGVDKDAADNWIEELENIKQQTTNTTKIYPGHGAEGKSDLFNKNIEYIKTFRAVIAKSKSKEDAFYLMKKIYPNYKGDFLLQRSIDNWFKEINIVDLTHTLNSEFPYIPHEVTFPFELKPIATIEENYVQANEWKIHEHIGTQIDAPNHFIKNGISLEKIGVKKLIIPAVVINISEKCANNPDAELTKQDIIDWEKENGDIPANACVFMYSGWEKHLYDKQFIGLDTKGTKHFPGISAEAANFLITERDISGVGVDVLSFDPGYDNAYNTHKIILGANKWALECVANLDKIPIKGASIFVGAPKVEGATGGFTRIIAFW